MWLVLVEQQQNNRLEIEAQRSLEEKQSLSDQIAVFQDEEKQREMELQELREEVQRLKLQQLDESKYREWGPDEIAAWIINLDPGRMMKYEKAVQSALKEDEADGTMLDAVDGGDLRQWGILKLGDRKFVKEQIANLLNGNKAPKGGSKMVPMQGANEGANAAPTAYM